MNDSKSAAAYHPLPTSDMVNHPPHYTAYPDGLYAECIEYTRHMPFSQGNAFKYLYRAGSKGDPAQDIEKAKWYLEDAIKYDAVSWRRDRPRINMNPTCRSYILWLIASGHLTSALDQLELHATHLDDPRSAA